MDERHGYIYFLSNKNNAVESHLFRVGMSDGSVTQVTHTHGVHAPEISPDESTFLDTYSSARVPPKQELDRIDGTKIAILAENDVPELAEYHLSPVEFKTVTAEDGTILHASMIQPPDFDPTRKYPVLIETYGGPDAQIVRDQWTGGLWSDIMAQKGYIIWSLDNRGSTGRGHNFETPIYHKFGKVELADQLAGVKYLEIAGICGWHADRYLGMELRRIHDTHGFVPCGRCIQSRRCRGAGARIGVCTILRTQNGTWERLKKTKPATGNLRRHILRRI